jgi:S-adenosylmethionine:tRNA ribosyltransferase-isomerase
MRKSDFDYRLPPERIAQFPVTPRSAGRLLSLDGAGGALRDMMFADFPSLLGAGDLLVFNDTRVIPARLHGAKETGGRVEALIERLLDERRVLAQVNASKPPRPGRRILFDGGVSARILSRTGEFYELEFESGEPVSRILERLGQVPLPPYIRRAEEALDRERYQTVYARAPGAVAAPTAGLHFDEPLLARLKARGVEFAWVTLHVGAGTFQPVRTEQIEQHRLHAEQLKVGEDVCARVRAARAAGRRVVAVGTTVVRALETAARTGALAPFEGETDIFITPGYRFRAVDALLTNFHLPQSTLLMLVCAFGGTGHALAAYRHAVAAGYRFYSYGDAMFVLPAVGRGAASE